MDPPRTAPGCGTIPTIALQVTLLPDPDSPTRPRISPCARSRSTFCAAKAIPRLVGKPILSPLMLKRGSEPTGGPRSLLSGVDGLRSPCEHTETLTQSVSHRVPHHAEPRTQQNDDGPRKRGHPPGLQ